MVEPTKIAADQVFDCIQISWIIPTQYHRATLSLVGKSTLFIVVISLVLKDVSCYGKATIYSI